MKKKKNFFFVFLFSSFLFVDVFVLKKKRDREKRKKTIFLFLLKLNVLGLLAILPPPVVGRDDARAGDGGADEVPRVGHELLVGGDAGVLLLDRLRAADEVGRVAGELDHGPHLVHRVLVLLRHLLGGHVRRQLLDLVLVLGHDPISAVEVDVVGALDAHDAVLAGELVGHEALRELVEADLGRGADLHAEDVAAVRREDLALLLVDELLGEGRVVVAEGSGLSTKDGGRTLKGSGAEAHSCASHIVVLVLF
jgi:hypothetical protein